MRVVGCEPKGSCASATDPKLPSAPGRAFTPRSSLPVNSAMMKHAFSCICAVLLLFLSLDCAEAHPHVWVTFHSEVLYAANGSMTVVRHAWTFDDMFSAYALQGI